MSARTLLAVAILSLSLARAADGADRYQATIVYSDGWESRALQVEWNRDLCWGCEQWDGYWWKQNIDARFTVEWRELGDHLGSPELRLGSRQIGTIDACPCSCGVGLLNLRKMLFAWMAARDDRRNYNQGYKDNVRRMIRAGLLDDGHDRVWLDGRFGYGRREEK